MVTRIGMGEDKWTKEEPGDRGTGDGKQLGIRYGDGDGKDQQVDGSVNKKETSDGEQPDVRAGDYEVGGDEHQGQK